MNATSLRILHVISAPAAGGAEVYVKQLALELRRQGHRPAIGFVSRAAEEGRDAEFERRYLAELTEGGIDFFFLGGASRKNPLGGAFHVRRFCKSNGVQLYHSHLKVGIVCGLLLRIPRLHTHHTSVPRVPRLAYGLFNLMVDQYVGISDRCSELLGSFTGRPVATVRNAIDISRFQPLVREPGMGSRFECISVGRIFAPKNFALLVRAIALLHPRILKRMHVSIVGEGPAHLVQALEKQIRQEGLGDRVKLLGNRSDIPELLERSDLFVMSSAWEGFPIALLEATASGLPFVATDVGGCREIAELCGNGVVVAAQDPQVLADAIADLVEHRDKLRRLSKAAIKSAPKLSIETAADAHIELYRDLLGERDSE